MFPCFITVAKKRMKINRRKLFWDSNAGFSSRPETEIVVALKDVGDGEREKPDSGCAFHPSVESGSNPTSSHHDYVHRVADDADDTQRRVDHFSQQIFGVRRSKVGTDSMKNCVRLERSNQTLPCLRICTDNCKRHPLTSIKTIRRIQRSGRKWVQHIEIQMLFIQLYFTTTLWCKGTTSRDNFNDVKSFISRNRYLAFSA